MRVCVLPRIRSGSLHTLSIKCITKLHSKPVLEVQNASRTYQFAFLMEDKTLTKINLG